MTLGELIEALKAEDPELVVPSGFSGPHSYRGFYHDLAFEPVRGATVGSMLACAKRALGTTYTGWKGGDFEMGEHTEVWLAEWGDCGETIGPTLLRLMIGEAKSRAAAELDKQDARGMAFERDICEP